MAWLCWSILLLCLSFNAENIAGIQKPGESVTLECSSAGCSSSIEGYNGMYLYHMDFKKQEEVLYYYSKPGSDDKITPRPRYINRIQTNGSLKNHNITISNLTVDDAGFYRCAYFAKPNNYTFCSVHTVFVGVGLNNEVVCGLIPIREFDVLHDPLSEKSPFLVVVICVICVISTLVTMIFILLIIPRVKRWASIRRTTRTPQVPNDCVYEVMTKNGLQPPAAPGHSTPSPYDFT